MSQAQSSETRKRPKSLPEGQVAKNVDASDREGGCDRKDEDKVEDQSDEAVDDEEVQDESDEEDVQSLNDSEDGVVESTELNDGDNIDGSGGIQASRSFVRSAAPSLGGSQDGDDESSDEETLFVSERKH